ncbi:hypothetical protein MMEU_2155 [Mycobacterium marinum str. Europe]|nr:hypothetical protein MMEU_2155 [Mycobacterium marinum str. Europe]
MCRSACRILDGSLPAHRSAEARDFGRGAARLARVERSPLAAGGFPLGDLRVTPPFPGNW